MTWSILTADCMAAMRAMPEASIDAIVTDPPYGLEFMGKAWDSFRVDDTGTARHRGDRAGNHGTTECADLSHPAGRSRVGIGGGKRPTTSRCVACGKRDQFRQAHACGESTNWIYEVLQADMAPATSLAFQEWVRQWAVEALRVIKPGGYMLAFGGTRMAHRLASGIEDAGWEIQDTFAWMYGNGFPKHRSKVKPAHEPIILARRPAQRATPLQIDACRLVGADTRRTKAGGPNDFPLEDDAWVPRSVEVGSASGRWPANVILDEDAAALLDEQTGTLTSGKMRAGQRREGIGYHGGLGNVVRNDTIGDSGGASRFFYVAKASRAERDAGCEQLASAPGGSNAKGFTADVAAGQDRNRPVKNHHPTVKPLSLLRWLVRLISPPGSTVLDPFAGSGTTGCAAALEHRDFIGIEQSAAYAAIASARIAYWATQAAPVASLDHTSPECMSHAG